LIAPTSAGISELRHVTVIPTTNTAGTVTNTYQYDAYGVPYAWPTVPLFGYTGQLALPQAQLWHYKARAYDPVSGRFLQTDPVGYSADVNLYDYASADPISGGDPSGTCPIVACGPSGQDSLSLPVGATDVSNIASGAAVSMTDGSPPTAATSPGTKHGTTIIGVGRTQTVSIPGLHGSASGSAAAGIAFDGKEARFFASGSGTGLFTSEPQKGESVVWGFLVGHHSGDPVDTGGFFRHGTFAAGDGPAISVDKFGGRSADNSRDVHGTSVLLGGGEGFSAGGGVSQTWVSQPIGRSNPSTALPSSPPAQQSAAERCSGDPASC